MAGLRSVLLLIADDWSPIAGCYGSPVIRTPHVDALAARGTLFTNAFCTTPSCAASRANILTRHYSHTHGQYGHVISCTRMRRPCSTSKLIPSNQRISFTIRHFRKSAKRCARRCGVSGRKRRTPGSSPRGRWVRRGWMEGNEKNDPAQRD